MSFQNKSMKRCPSLLNDTLQIVEDMNLLYIRQISKKLQVHIVVCNMENDHVCIPKTVFGLYHFEPKKIKLKLVVF